MTKLRAPLAKTYGKLTVKESYVKDGQYLTVVECECGRVKSVFTSALRSGRTKSCGAVLCRSSRSHLKRPKTRTKLQPGIPLSGRPRQLRLRQIWRRVVDDNETMTSVAEDLGVSPHSIYYLISRIRAKGGIDPYIEWENRK